MMSRALNSLLGLMLIAYAGAAFSATTGLELISTPGDYIGGGITQTFRSPASNIKVSGTASVAHVTVSDNSTGLNLDFASPTNTTLRVGRYAAAERYPFNSPLGAGLSVDGDGRGCNTLKGWFSVKEYELNSAGAVTRLAIDFVQNCEVTGPPLYGAIRFNSQYPLTVPEAAAVAGVDFDVTEGQTATLDGTQSFSRDSGGLRYSWLQVSGPRIALTGGTTATPSFNAPSVRLAGATLRFMLLVSDGHGHLGADDVIVLVNSSRAPRTEAMFHGDAGDYITGGNAYYFDKQNSSITFSNNFDAGVSVSISGNSFWSLDFAPPSGSSLTPGTYENALRFPFQGSAPGLSLSGDGRGCNTLTGNFTVYKSSFDAQGKPKTLDIVFTQHCEGTPPAAYGEVVLNAVPRSVSSAILLAARKSISN